VFYCVDPLRIDMDPVQEKQLKRFTSTMWAVLRYTANRGPTAKIGGPLAAPGACP
jgi:hypothetical protein